MIPIRASTTRTASSSILFLYTEYRFNKNFVNNTLADKINRTVAGFLFNPVYFFLCMLELLDVVISDVRETFHSLLSNNNKNRL